MSDLRDTLSRAASSWLLTLALRDLARRKRDGVPWPVDARAAIDALAEWSDTRAPTIEGADSGTSSARVIEGPWLDPSAEVAHHIPVAAAARLVGKSEGYVRRLARQGRVRHSRPGRDWLVDPESLRSVIARSAAS